MTDPDYGPYTGHSQDPRYFGPTDDDWRELAIEELVAEKLADATWCLDQAMTQGWENRLCALIHTVATNNKASWLWALQDLHRALRKDALAELTEEEVAARVAMITPGADEC